MELVKLAFSLLELVCVLMVVGYLLMRTRVYQEIERNQFTVRNRILLMLIFGALSIYGTVCGIEAFGAVANTRDLGPLIAGLIGGPIVGIGAGAIGALHRSFLGGWTCFPCVLGTLLAGLIGGLVFRFRRGGGFIAPLPALLLAAGVEILHLVMVIFVGDKPMLEAAPLAVMIVTPMIIANAFGLAAFSFLMRNYLQEQATRAAKEKIEGELKVAREIQESMLPHIFPAFPGREEFNVFASVEPAVEMGGDFYDFFLIDNDRLCFHIGDVTGKGVPAALFMVIIKTLLKNEAQRGLPPAEVFARVNDMIAQDNDSSTFATIFYVVLDLRTGELEYIDAGHNPPLLRAPGGSFAYLPSVKNPVLGPLPGLTFKSGRLTLAHGSTLLLYTDGVNEAMDNGGEQFTYDRLLAAANRRPGDDEANLIRGVRAEVAAFTGGAPQSDDITMLALRFH